MVLSADDSILTSDSTISDGAKFISWRRLRLIFPCPFRLFTCIRQTVTPSVTPEDDSSLSSGSSISISRINFKPNIPPFLKRNRGVLLGLLATGIIIFYGMLSNMSQYEPYLEQRISLVQSVPLTIVFQIHFLKSEFLDVNPTLCYALNDLMDFNIIENVTTSLQSLSDEEFNVTEIQKGS